MLDYWFGEDTSWFDRVMGVLQAVMMLGVWLAVVAFMTWHMPSTLVSGCMATLACMPFVYLAVLAEERRVGGDLFYIAMVLLCIPTMIVVVALITPGGQGLIVAPALVLGLGWPVSVGVRRELLLLPIPPKGRDGSMRRLYRRKPGFFRGNAYRAN